MAFILVGLPIDFGDRQTQHCSINAIVSTVG